MIFNIDYSNKIMEIELPLELILQINKSVTSDITLEYYNCHLVEHKRVQKSILTDYYRSFYIKQKSKIFILEQINNSKLETIKNARLVCKSWAISIVDVLKLTNCRLNYNSTIFNMFTQHGLSDEYYQSYRKFYNQKLINKLKRYFRMENIHHVRIIPYYQFICPSESNLGELCGLYKCITLCSDTNLSKNYNNKVMSTKNNNKKITLYSDTNCRQNYKNKNIYLYQKIIPKHIKMPKMKSYHFNH